MKKILLTFCLFTLAFALFSKTWVITANGFATEFTPNAITITLGDSVLFTLDPIQHNAREISQADWNMNGTTSNGGFILGEGGGLVLPANLAIGTHYYICTNHASMGMKGTIIVQGQTSSLKTTRNKMSSRAYPNPFSNKLIVEITGADAVSIYNLLGEKMSVIFLKNNETSIEIDTNNFPKGIYLYSVLKDGITLETRKITKL